MAAEIHSQRICDGRVAMILVVIWRSIWLLKHTTRETVGNDADSNSDLGVKSDG